MLYHRRRKNLARNTFIPYQCKEIVTGLGVASPIGKIDEERNIFLEAFPILRCKKFLLYLGRFHPKKGIDLLINSFLKTAQKEDKLVLAGPRDTSNKYEKFLCSLIPENEKRIIWTGMLKGDQKWGALHSANALIFAFPSRKLWNGGGRISFGWNPCFYYK